MKNKPVDLEKGKQIWKLQQNDKKLTEKIKRRGGTIYNEDGSPSLSYVTVALTIPDKWYNLLEFATSSDCTSNAYENLVAYSVVGNGCFTSGTYDYATQQFTETGSLEYDVYDDGTNAVVYSGAYSSLDCSGSVSGAQTTTAVLGCSGVYYGAYATSQPIEDSMSPFTNNVPGIGETFYANDNQNGDTDYLTWMDWQSLSEYTSGVFTSFDSCTDVSGTNTIVSCTDEALLKTTYTGACEDANILGTDDYESAIVKEYIDDDATTGTANYENFWFYSQNLCSGGTYTPAADDTDDTAETDDTDNDNTDDESNDATCFAGSEMVTLESGLSKPIADVVVGDRVLASNAQGVFTYSDVIAVPHAKNNYRVMFNEISLTNGADIRMTGEHLLPVAASCGVDAVFTITAAKNVAIDSCVMTTNGQSNVVSNNKIPGTGIYTIVTNEEYVVVNGVIASPFAVSHTVGNTFYNVYRVMYNYVPGAFKSSIFQSFHSTFATLAMKTW